MLNLKLGKTGLTGNSILLLIAVVSVAATHQMGDGSGLSKDDTTVHQLSFDTMLLRLNGASEISELEVPAIGMNKQAVVYVNDYMKKNKELLGKIKDRSSSFFKITDAVFNKYHLPEELKYLAVIESQLKTSALSPVGAKGAWQLMPKTARILSLKITARYDERTHFYKSTVAAAKYLKDLHKIFGDWLLVIAAYNSGPGRVFQAIKKSGSRNFWKLQNFLPAETRGHVKKFISTHYYFEGQGSVTTLTKDEASAYKKLMATFVEKQNLILRERQMPQVIASINENKADDGNTAVVLNSELKLKTVNEK